MANGGVDAYGWTDEAVVKIETVEERNKRLEYEQLNLQFRDTFNEKQEEVKKNDT